MSTFVSIVSYWFNMSTKRTDRKIDRDGQTD